jgi:nucleotide-binding universal stress UspA family protein
MDRPVVVPLDGSALAAEALPLARTVATHLGAPLHLVRVHEPAKTLIARVADGPTVAGYEDRRARAAAARYLEEVKESFAEDLGTGRVVTAVLDGPVGEALVSYGASRRARLFVMKTDQRGALGRRLFGSVTDQVIRRAATPVLLAGASRERGIPAGASGFARILVPLDGAGPAAGILEEALAMGGAAPAGYVLTRTVPAELMEDPEPGTATLPLRWARELAGEALADLRRWAAALRTRGYSVETRLVAGRGPEDGTARVAEEIDADLIVLTLPTGGLAGRLLVGSSAREILQRTARPVLICPPRAPVGPRDGERYDLERAPAGAA